MPNNKEHVRAYQREYYSEHKKQINDKRKTHSQAITQEAREERIYRKQKLHPLMVSKGYKIRQGMVFTCLVCGKDFYLQPCHAKSNGGEGKKSTKYCSMECFVKSLRTNKPLACIVCNKPFYCSKSQQKLRNRRTCSRKCNGVIVGKAQSGANSRFWRGGVSSENRIIRSSSKMETWRRSVFSNNNYTCQRCGIYGGYLHAHHIKPFASYLNLRFEVSNGITLCGGCHYVIHKEEKIYPQNKNTESIGNQESRRIVEKGNPKKRQWNLPEMRQTGEQLTPYLHEGYKALTT